MKIKILFGTLFITLLNYAQAPINTFYGDAGPYLLAVTAVPLDQTASGANINWNFTQLTQVGTAVHSYQMPTEADINLYPGTTMVSDIVATVDGIETASQVFSSDVSNVVSITGIANPGLSLNYITNNATFGTFPLNYGHTLTDPVAGTYIYGTYTGTFSGTMTTSVDAYGIFNVNLGNVPANTPVTRLKTVQSLSLNYSVFTNVGTGTQTTYSYYNSDTGTSIPVFRYAITYINVPLLSINQTITDIEVYNGSLLGTDRNEMLTSKMQIVPNPVANELNIEMNPGILIERVTINDSAGRMVFARSTNEKTIDVGGLQKGVYFAKVTNSSGTYIQKFIKL